MSKFFPLFSSSKGNSVYLAGGGTSLLIDCGISPKQLSSALSAHGFDIRAVNGLLITHEHSDHIRGLNVLLKHTNIPLYASRGTLEYLIGQNLIPAHTDVFPVEGAFEIRDITLRAFPTPHDAPDSVGYRFSLPDGRTAAVATDLGHVSETVHQNLLGCDLVMLESNYDRRMLECSSYPYILKRRIKSEFGHLGNEASAAEALFLAKSGTTRIVLGHLSEQNNLPEIAFETARAALGSGGLRENVDYILKVAPPRDASDVILF